MKKIIGILLFIPMLASAQTSIHDTKAYVYGLDFSKAKLVGAVGFTNPAQVKDYYFNEWNNLLVNEKDKYNIPKFFKKSEVIYDLSVVEKRNKAVKMDGLVTESPYELEDKEVEKIISSYKTEQKSGLGIVFVVNSFDKLNEKATLHVVLFDLSNKKILAMDKMSQDPSGFGIRNYWMGAVYGIMKKVPKNKNIWSK